MIEKMLIKALECRGDVSLAITYVPIFMLALKSKGILSVQSVFNNPLEVIGAVVFVPMIFFVLFLIVAASLLSIIFSKDIIWGCDFLIGNQDKKLITAVIVGSASLVFLFIGV